MNKVTAVAPTGQVPLTVNLVQLPVEIAVLVPVVWAIKVPPVTSEYH